jgi:hypothetical protein
MNLFLYSKCRIEEIRKFKANALEFAEGQRSIDWKVNLLQGLHHNVVSVSRMELSHDFHELFVVYDAVAFGVVPCKNEPH